MAVESEFTLLIAGPDHDNTQKMIRLNERGGGATKTVVSRWGNGNSVLSEVQIVSSPPLSLEKLKRVHNSQNIYLQATTVVAGLEQVDTPYVIKARSDEFFSNLLLMVEQFNPNKLLSANIFVRDVSYKPYHISDHLFIGSTARLKSAYESLKKYIEDAQLRGDPWRILNSITPAEVKIGLFYLQACGYRIDDLIALPPAGAFDVMKNEIDIFDVDLLRPFEVSSSACGKIKNYSKFVFHDPVLELRHITSICQMAPQGEAARLFQRLIVKLRRLLSKVST